MSGELIVKSSLGRGAAIAWRNHVIENNPETENNPDPETVCSILEIACSTLETGVCGLETGA